MDPDNFDNETYDFVNYYTERHDIRLETSRRHYHGFIERIDNNDSEAVEKRANELSQRRNTQKIIRDQQKQFFEILQAKTNKTVEEQNQLNAIIQKKKNQSEKMRNHRKAMKEFKNLKKKDLSEMSSNEKSLFESFKEKEEKN